MPLLLTNDDGIDAPGIAALAQAVRQAIPTQTAIVIAPQQGHSGCGHQVTTHRPLQVTPRPDSALIPPTDTSQAFAIDGTPADCTRLAIAHLCPNPTWVLSGINAGGNLGVDLPISGTVAAVREAAYHGLPGIAFSQYIRGRQPIDWEIATTWAIAVLNHLMALELPSGSFWNVNFPWPTPNTTPDSPPPKLVFCDPCRRPLPLNYQQTGEQFLYAGSYSQRETLPGTDVTACFGGAIAITQIAAL